MRAVGEVAVLATAVRTGLLRSLLRAALPRLRREQQQQVTHRRHKLPLEWAAGRTWGAAAAPPLAIAATLVPRLLSSCCSCIQ